MWSHIQKYLEAKQATADLQNYSTSQANPWLFLFSKCTKTFIHNTNVIKIFKHANYKVVFLQMFVLQTLFIIQTYCFVYFFYYIYTCFD